MTMNVYCIRDIYTGFLSPTYDVSDNSAKRNFSHAVRRPDSLLNSHPKDYSLYCIGTFDTENGSLAAVNPIRLVCEAVDLMEDN